MDFITIDVGTSNSRIRYIDNGSIVSQHKSRVGVKDTAISGSKGRLVNTLREGIEKCIAKSGKTLEDVTAIIASGMITSSLGLIEIPHVEAPVGVGELRDAIVEKKFDDIVKKPILFIPGVKNRVDGGSFDEMDMMRGEEVEAIGAMKIMGLNGEAVFISPGSHTKIVFINHENKIDKCSTTLTGEIIWAITRETVITDSINSNIITEIDEEFVKKGIAAVKRYGFSKACYMVRIMDIFKNSTSNQLANFLAGAVGYYDIHSIKEELMTREPGIVIGGGSVLRELYGLILEIEGYRSDKITLMSDEAVEHATCVGAIEIYG